ncbi:MAG: hypothetical protein QXQ53_04805 [Candidatus Methanosuratincola sp.]
MATVQITRLLPKHYEIMTRLLLGQKEVDIARDLGMSVSRVSIIVNSPLFQLELKRQLKKRQKRIHDIEEMVMDAAEAGAELMKKSLANPNVPLPIRVEIGNKALTHLFGRIIRQMPSVEVESTDPNNLPYEKKLEREITLRETTYFPNPPHSSPPPPSPSTESSDTSPPLDSFYERESEGGVDALLNALDESEEEEWNDSPDLPFDEELIEDEDEDTDDAP